MSVEFAQCQEDPEKLAGQPIGMYHCPDCGCMVLAGMKHGPHEEDVCQLRIVGTYDGVKKTLQDLWDDYLKELVEIAAVAVSAIQDLDLGVAQIDDTSFHDIWQETLSTIEEGYWVRENPTEWVTDIGRDYGYVCLYAGINDLPLFRRSLIWLTATCIAAYSDMTDQTPYDQLWEFVVAERHRQDAKWGEQHHTPKGWLPILGEEFGEMCEAAMRIDFAQVRALDGMVAESDQGGVIGSTADSGSAGPGSTPSPGAER